MRQQPATGNRSSRSWAALLPATADALPRSDLGLLTDARMMFPKCHRFPHPKTHSNPHVTSSALPIYFKDTSPKKRSERENKAMVRISLKAYKEIPAPPRQTFPATHARRFRKAGAGMGVLEAAASGTEHRSVSLTTHGQQAPSVASTRTTGKKNLMGKQTWSQRAQIPDRAGSLKHSHSGIL